MMPPSIRNYSSWPGGFVFVSALLILAVMMMVMLKMSRNIIAEEAMSGNTKEKARALQAAQNAVIGAEWWLQQAGNASGGDNCPDGALNGSKVCTNEVRLDKLDVTPPLSSWTDHTPAGMTFSQSGGAGTYYRAPGNYIHYLYSTPDGDSNFYRITGFGYGGNQDAVAVVQSYYRIDFTVNASGARVRNAGGL